MASVISALADLTRATKSPGDVIAASETNTWSASVISLTSDFIDCLQALETCYASASQPTDRPKGKIWANTTATNPVWGGYVTNSGSLAIFIDTKSGYLQNMETGGTATFRQGGKIGVVTTGVTKTGSAGVLMTYTVPANTLYTNGASIRFEAWGTKGGSATGKAVLTPRWGTTVLTTHTLAANVTNWHMYGEIVRVSAGSQKVGVYIVPNRDDTGETQLCQYAAHTKDETTALALDINVPTIHANDTVAQELLLVMFNNAPS